MRTFGYIPEVPEYISASRPTTFNHKKAPGGSISRGITKCIVGKMSLLLILSAGVPKTLTKKITPRDRHCRPKRATLAPARG